MKASSSRGMNLPYKERSSTQNATQKYTKPPTAKLITPLANVNFNVTAIEKKNQMKKPMPPKPPSKTQFNVEVNMTESKIFQAKQGLQLLKKKMNRTGMSRQKNYSHTEKNGENLPTFNRANSNQALNAEKNMNLKKTNSATGQRPQVLIKPLKKQAAIKTAQSQQRLFNKARNNEYQDERPIAKSNNFIQLFEKQMKKQENINMAKPTNKNKIFDQNGKEIILEYCSKGCGRQFNPQTLQKHEKVCEKVFQSKRKAFNSASHRLPGAQGFIPPPQTTNKIEEKPKKKNEIPKWKLQSAAFRAGIKLGKNKPLTKEQEAMMQINQQNRVCCEYCGRRFSDEAAKRHVPFCQRKSKEIGKNAMKGRK